MSDIEVSGSQKRMLVDLIQNHFMEMVKKGKSWGDHVISSQLWEKIATTLNKMGPHRNADGWKTFYQKIKAETKGKVGAQRSYINKTGSGLPLVQLTELDMKITSLYGKNHFDGQQGVSECGFPGRKFTPNPSLNSISDTPLRNAGIGLQPQSRAKKRANRSNSTAPKTCNLCGGPEGNIECRLCCKFLCARCDDAYHRHPLRQGHNRKKVLHPTKEQVNMLFDMVNSYYRQSDKQYGHLIPPDTWNVIGSVLNDMGPPFRDGIGWSYHYDFLCEARKSQ